MTVVTQPQPFACPACSATIFWPPLPAKQSAKKQKIEFWSDGYDPNAPTNLVDCPFCLSLFPRYFATSLSHVTGVVPRLDYLTPVVAVRNDDNSDVSSSIENLARIPGYKSWRGAVYLGPRPLEDADPIFLALCIESILHSFNNRVRVKARSGQKNSSLSAESVMSSFLGGLITQVGFSDAYESPHSNIFGMDMNNFMGDAKWCLILAEAARTVGLFHLGTQWANRATEILWQESPIRSDNEIELKRAQVIATLSGTRNAALSLFEPDKVELAPPRKVIPPRTFDDTETSSVDSFGPDGGTERVIDPSTMSPKEINLQVAAGRDDLVRRELQYRKENPEVVQRLSRRFATVLTLIDHEAAERTSQQIDLRLLSDVQVARQALNSFEAVQELDFRGFSERQIGEMTEGGLSMPLTMRLATYLFYDDTAQKILGACLYIAEAKSHSFQGWTTGGKGWEAAYSGKTFRDFISNIMSLKVSVWELDEAEQTGGNDEDWDINTFGSAALRSVRDNTWYPRASLKEVAQPVEMGHYWPHWFEPAFAF